jgi:hypothetical protein
MARLILENVEPEILEALELRAKRLGTTPAREASRLLGERLRPASVPATPAPEAGVDARFVRDGGLLVFTGAIAAEDIPDHRTLRDDRIDGLLREADG